MPTGLAGCNAGIDCALTQTFKTTNDQIVLKKITEFAD